MIHPGAPFLAPPSGVLLPCAESCGYFGRIHPDRWAEFGRCANPRSPRCGYPVRLGRNCRLHETHGIADRMPFHPAGPLG